MNYLVVGLGKSGISACELLVRNGDNVFAYDENHKKAKELLDLKILNEKVVLLKKLKTQFLKTINKIVISPGVPTKKFLAVANKFSIEIISELELGFNFCPSKILAITGTNGKTTTTKLLGNILKCDKQDVFVVGNVGTAITSCVLEMKESSVAVCEVSNFQLENIKKFKPYIAAFLNIAPDHMDRYKCFDDYFNAKLRIFENMAKDDVAVLNYDDALLRFYTDDLICDKLYFSLNKLPKDVFGAYLDDNKICFNINEKEVFEIEVDRVKIRGNHNLQNIMCAGIMALKYGVKPQSLQKGIETFVGLEHRIEFVGKIGKTKFYNDSKATNINSTITAVNAFNEDITLLLGGSDKKENFAFLFSRLPKNVKKIVTFGKMAKKIYIHGINSGFNNIAMAENLEDAFNSVCKNLSTEVVLLSPACASFDEFDNYEERGAYFKYLVKGLIE